MPAIDELASQLSGEIETSPEVLQKFSTDASIFQVSPQAIIAPADETDLSLLVTHISKRKKTGEQVSLTPRNGGTCMSGGSLTTSYMLHMSRHFNRIDPISLEDKSIWVQGGVMHKDIEAATHPHGLFFAPYTSSRDICGIGGMIGNNASGEKSVKYGPTSDNVTCLKVMLSDGRVYEFGPLSIYDLEAKKQLSTLEGQIYRDLTKLIDDNRSIIENHPRLKKNAAGYALWELWNQDKSIFNLSRLFIGAQGTLGIVTQAQLKLTPFPKASRMIVAPIPTLSFLTDTVKTLLFFNPDVCETFDHHTYNLAKQYHPEDAARAHVADGKHLLVFAVYTGDDQHQVDVNAGQAKETLERMGREVVWIDDPATLESFLLIRRKSFKMLLEHPYPNTHAMPFLEDTIVPLDHYGEFLAALEAILSDYNMIYTYAGHIGDGSIRLVPLMNVEESGAAEKVLEISRKVYDLVFAFGGSMSVDHNDGLIRTIFLERMYGPEMIKLFEQVKDLFDPLNIFNPGKKVRGDRQFTRDHIVRKNA